MPQLDDHVRQAHRFLGKGDRPNLDRAAVGQKGAHAGQDRVAFGKGRGDGRVLGGDLCFQRGQFVGLLCQKPRHRAAAGKSRQLARGFAFRQVGEAFAQTGHVAFQPLAFDRDLVRPFQRGLVVGQRDLEMPFDGRRPGECRGVQPGRHGDDGGRPQEHGEREAQACGQGAHGGQKPHQVGPEHEDRDRHGDRIGECREHPQGTRVIEQRGHAEVGIDAGRHRQHAKGRPGEGIEPGDVPFQFARRPRAAFVGHGAPHLSPPAGLPAATAQP